MLNQEPRARRRFNQTPSRARRNSMRAATRRGGLHLPSQEDRNRRDDEHDAEDREGIAEAHHQRLPLDRVAERDDRLIVRGGGVRRALSQEISGHLRDARAYFLSA